MATVGIWSVKNNLSRVIDYISDEKKVDEQTFKDLHNELEYISDDYKTEEKKYVTGINCSTNNACKEMKEIKKHFQKEDGIIAFHAYQSFKEGEVTPEQAHNIGIQLAEEMWGDRFQVVVATHLNTNHIHNHFVINSVSFVDGKKYYDNRMSYAELRRLNDQICMEHDLSYLEEKKTKKGLYYINYQDKADKIIYSKQTKSDVDMAIALANSYSEFLHILENMNYEVKERASKLSVRNLEYKRNIRIERQFGNDYSIENIKKQIAGIYLPEKQNQYRRYFEKDKVIDTLMKMNCKGLAFKYINYLKLLNKYPTYIRSHRVSNQLQRDVMQMNLISNQTIFLAKYRIDTLDDLENKYKELRRETRIKKEDNNLKDELHICESIIFRKNSILDEEKENKKEVVVHESIK